MRTLVKALIVMMAISGLAFMGCDNGTTNGNGGNGNDPGNRVIAEQYRGTFATEQFNFGGSMFIETIVLGENTVTRTTTGIAIAGPDETTDHPPFPAWTEGNTLRGRPFLYTNNEPMILTLGSFNAEGTVFTGTGYWLNHTFTRVP